MKVASVVGARPNFIKLAPIHNALKSFAEHTIIHTGQHYDYEMSEVFFKEFKLPEPDYNLEVGSGSFGHQLGETTKKLEKILTESKFDLVLVYGDTNSTFAGALSAMRSGIKVAHIEAGLRSFDRRMPEETNRVMTDHISDYLFAPTHTSVNNLKRENTYGQIFYTGDISVETVRSAIKLASKSGILQQLRLQPKSYYLITIHRAENTDTKEKMSDIISALESLSDTEFVFPIHPRTLTSLKEKGLFDRLSRCKNVKVIQPVGYIDFVKLMQSAIKIITDSGGIQKEAYLLSIPCITVRKSTEWIETVNEGWNITTDIDIPAIVKAVREWLPSKKKVTPIFGDGSTSTNIAGIIRSTLMALPAKR
jgi:UDP-N-acetylglucosamine 2-epimerase